LRRFLAARLVHFLVAAFSMFACGMTLIVRVRNSNAVHTRFMFAYRTSRGPLSLFLAGSCSRWSLFCLSLLPDINAVNSASASQRVDRKAGKRGTKTAQLFNGIGLATAGAAAALALHAPKR